MTYPTITHIDDVLPHIDGHPEFIVAEKDGYTVIDYVFSQPDTFDDPVRFECRGIKFTGDGQLLSRPLHKFFNIGEREDTQPHVLDFAQPHTITEKLDGSMIHAALLDGEVVFMTRMGHTDVARKAERHLTQGILDWCRRHPDWTPIFEWTAPENRIVVRYEESQLSLLAVRRNLSGEYLPRWKIAHIARAFGTPLVRQVTSDWNTGQAFVDYARVVRGMEGFVIAFEDGTFVKAKGEDYVLKHRAKDSITQEKNVLALILSGEFDDILPLLDAADRGDIENYRRSLENGMWYTAREIEYHVDAGRDLDQKAFAIEHQPRIDKKLRPLAYSVRAGADPDHIVRKAILKATSSQTAVDEARHLHGAKWPM